MIMRFDDAFKYLCKAALNDVSSTLFVSSFPFQNLSNKFLEMNMSSAGYNTDKLSENR